MTAQVIKIGQVWKSKTTAEKVAIVATSWNKVFVSGTIDEVDPEWEKKYLVENYELDYE